MYSLRQLRKCYHLSWILTIVQSLVCLVSVPLKPLFPITIFSPLLFPYHDQVSGLSVLLGLPCGFPLSVGGQFSSCFVCCIGNNNITVVSACKTKLNKLVWLQVGSYQPCVHKLVSEWHFQPLPSCNPCTSLQDPVILHHSLRLFDWSLHHFLTSCRQSKLELVTQREAERSW